MYRVSECVHFSHDVLQFECDEHSFYSFKAKEKQYNIQPAKEKACVAAGKIVQKFNSTHRQLMEFTLEGK